MTAAAMRQTTTVAGVRAAVAGWRRAGHRVAFVPTMGAIHAGHTSLVRRARAVTRGRRAKVVASVFVNPLQFGPHEDFRRYPRPLARDRALLARAGADLLWVPSVRTLYPPGDLTRVRVPGLGDVLEGGSRPGHFEGVATVVLKLLEVVSPDVLWVGQKDAQQAVVIQRMVRDLRLPVAVRRGATVREKDGLALSSRNAYLDPGQRAQAVALWRGLRAAREALDQGARSAAQVAARVRKVWKQHPQVKEDYVAVVSARTLEPIRDPQREGRVLVAVAARVGRARLIDNIEWEPR